ncbi:MAG: hypothetical protein JWP57_3674 [Spirosoma sp.]|nr:hypothetical protein [Spirosoma sp.]
MTCPVLQCSSSCYKGMAYRPASNYGVLEVGSSTAYEVLLGVAVLIFIIAI